MMDPLSERVRVLPVPAWLAAHSEPNIEAMAAILGPETQELYLRFLADEVRSVRIAGRPAPCLLAFTRAIRKVERRNRERHPEHWPA
jgi:hypothetical protein